jgi:FkbM family methyltransferase
MAKHEYHTPCGMVAMNSIVEEPDYAIQAGINTFREMFLLVQHHYSRHGNKLTFLDIGANNGIVSVLMAKCFPDIQIIAVEAHPQIADSLASNIKMHGLNNVTILNKAVYNGENIPMTEMECMNEANSGVFTAYYEQVEADRHKDQKTYNVQSVLLNDVISLSQGPCVIKMDIEGAEFEVLEHPVSFQNLKKIQTFFSELHGLGGPKMKKHLNNLGYKHTHRDYQQYVYDNIGIQIVQDKTDRICTYK